MRHPIQFAHTSDGVLIAFRQTGEGPPVLGTPAWVSHLELDLQLRRLFPSFYDELSTHRTVIEFDGRGTGLSDRDVPDVSAPARARDIEAVVDHLGLESVTLFIWSLNSPAGIIYAATHPERVSRLICYAAFARYTAPGREPLGRAFVDLIRAEWGLGSRTIVDFIAPGAAKETTESLFRIDVREHLPRLTMPALVVHRRDDPAVPFDCGRELAALLPHAQFVPLTGDQHLPWQGDTAALLATILTFLGEEAGRSQATAAPRATAEPAAALQIIFFSDMSGSTALTSRLGDAAAQEVLRVHDAIVRDALRHHGGAEIKHTGDGIMAAFPSASGAMECAIAVQRALAAHNERHRDEAIRVRIGLNAGEPLAEGEDLFGSAVQAAARITERARPGQILVADVVRQLAAGKGFAFSNRGRVALKGFPHRFRLHEVRWAE
ncbi:MAG: adenylate/guanylate cyclase domain-containing protein [Deltaproteobacteria bacterium]|nr:MAG: adenylate/guanylate cyclase domain-containing protein [Deltaproteobacteria bacterium]